MSGLFIVRRTALQVSVLKPIGYKILLEVLVRGTIQNITDVPYVFDERRHGRSKVTLRVYREYLAHLWQLRQAVRRSD
jgi:dolichol-phosphate mannosyltransferase